MYIMIDDEKYVSAEELVEHYNAAVSQLVDPDPYIINNRRTSVAGLKNSWLRVYRCYPEERLVVKEVDVERYIYRLLHEKEKTPQNWNRAALFNRALCEVDDTAKNYCFVEGEGLKSSFFLDTTKYVCRGGFRAKPRTLYVWHAYCEYERESQKRHKEQQKLENFDKLEEYFESEIKRQQEALEALKSLRRAYGIPEKETIEIEGNAA